MASIIEEKIVVTVSRIVKSGTDTPDTIVTDEIMQTVEIMASELFDGAVVEVTKED